MEENKESNSIDLVQEIFVSTKRIEFLLEELIFQQIIPRTKDAKEASEKFTIALTNVSDRIKSYILISEIDPKSK